MSTQDIPGRPMQPDKPSQTAVATALLRALHMVADDAPAVFEDGDAVTLLPSYLKRYVRRLSELPRPWLKTFRLRRSGMTAMRAQVIVRARYAEDVLAELRQTQGCERLVVLAAGLDTFALRQTTSAEPIDVLEIDHPATQRWKRQRLEDLGYGDVSHLAYLPIDFEQSTLAEKLASEKPRRQTISWLGTTYYLTVPALTETLKALADCSAAGSRLVLDFWQQPSKPDLDSLLLLGTRVATALQREPMKTFMTPQQMGGLLESSGWRVIESCDAATQNQRYLSQRRDGLQVPRFAHVLQAEKR